MCRLTKLYFIKKIRLENRQKYFKSLVMIMTMCGVWVVHILETQRTKQFVRIKVNNYYGIMHIVINM